jgi:hypothetical protein
MFDELHPAAPGETPAQMEERQVRFNTANPLRIASEYEAAFTRRKLDLQIRKQIPDSEHQPGSLHRLLLRLPWADVFTTNYDTLLERTEVPGRTYQHVTCARELTTAFAPRIVKLHGSLSSQSSFIISEENYRTYPQLFAPFVNSVQKSLLENSFALIGFSGDDPNFLEWTGWIRDELGENHAPIYLVGLLSLDHAGRSLLARRGVTPIDLSPIFERFEPAKALHAASIEWFLHCLFAGRPPRQEKWPELDQVSEPVPDRIPPIVKADLIVPERITPSPTSFGPLKIEEVTKVLKRWKFEREKYPGWLIAAEDKRSRVWENTKAWIQPLIQFARDKAAAERIFLFREINWRLEISMVPLLSEWAEPFQKAADELFDRLEQGLSALPSHDLAPANHASNSEVADALLEIAFSLLRAARESYDISRWNELKTKIDKLVRENDQHSNRNRYEAALWAIWNVDRASAKSTLSDWPPSLRSPLALMRKAGLLAELDELGEARTILRIALDEIRRAVRIQGRNIELLSLEGWCMYLLAALGLSLDLINRTTVPDEFWERWDELKAWDCSPWPHKEYFDNALSVPPPPFQSDEREVRGFDPGKVSVSLRFGGDNIAPFLPGFACIRFYEQVGVPMRLRLVNIAGDNLKSACRWIAPFSGFWSPALLIRAGRLDDLTRGDFLNRAQVAAMHSDLANRLYMWCMRILERELASLTGLIAMGSAQESMLGVLPEVLSRLAFKVGAAELRRTFPLVLYLHRQPGVRLHLTLHKSCDPWFERLFDAAETELLLEWLPDLIKEPLIDERVHPVVPANQAWPDPAVHFPSWRIRRRRIREVRSDLLGRISEETDWLLARASSESGEGRQRAIVRLAKIYHTGMMTTDQQQKLGELLWNKRAANNLPDLPGFATTAFLHLPAPPGVDAASLVKNQILTLTTYGAVSQDQLGRTTIMVSGSEQPLIYEASLASKPFVQLADEASGTVEWTQEEAKQLYQKAREWWANDKRAFEPGNSPSSSLMGNLVLRSLTRLGQFLARVVMPHMEGAPESDWQQILEWLREIRGVGAYPTLALPYVLLHRPSEAQTVGETIAGDLASENEDAVAAASMALRHWIHLSAIGRVANPPSGLVASLLERVIFRRKPGIHPCLRHLAHLITERQEAITLSQAVLLNASLVPWHLATILPTPEGGGGDFHEEERPALREKVAMLAGALKIWYGKSSPGLAEPFGVGLWRDSSKSDCLPEVRRAFDFWD